MTGSDWEKRYRTGDMPWEKGEASPGLIDFLDTHKSLAHQKSPARRRQHANSRAVLSASVCVPGCGTGHDVRAWVKAGFSVTGFDLAPTAIQLARTRTAAAGLPAKFVRSDFLKTSPARRFDWAFEHTLFCAINPKDRPRYVRAVRRALKPGGQFLAVFYLIQDTDGPPFGTTRAELWQRFSPYFKLVREWVPRSYPYRTGLELMMWWKKIARPRRG